MKPATVSPIKIARRGLMLVISSPSGAGKSTIARNLLEADPDLSISVSVTTRSRRPSEIEGRHYFFKSIREFEALRATDSLLEWAEVHGNYYGTPRDAVEKAMGEGRDMLFDIDWQGAQQLQEKMAGDVVSIFILPPSMAELQSRLHRRAEDSEEVIATRLANSRAESSTGANTITSWSTTISTGPSPPSGRSSKPSAFAATGAPASSNSSTDC